MSNPRPYDYATTLLASAARTVTALSIGDPVKLPDANNGYIFSLHLTAATTDVGDTLDAGIQTRIGNDWVTICSFTQCLGNGGDKVHVGKVLSGTAQAMFEIDAALTAGNVRHICGDEYRVAWIIADADADASFTFSVTATPL
jgi:hypothetical protein